MKFKSLKYIRNLAGKRVLVRCDFDLPMKNCKIIDDTRLKACVPTIKYLLFKGAKVVLVGHLGRPKGVDEKLSLLPVKNKLEKILEKKEFAKKSYTFICKIMSLLCTRVRFTP